jgi:14-3-3 protein epsilon
MNCYNEAFEYCKKLPFTNDVRLGLVLNFGVFFNDILNDPKNALNVTNDTYNALIKEIDNLDDKQYNIINPIANLIKENIDNWNSSVNESNKEVNNVKIMEYA